MFARGISLAIPDVDPTPQDGYVATWVAALGRAVWKVAASPFNPASPGPIGGTTPGAGTFTTLVGTDTTDTTGSGSGAVQIAGGAYVAKTLYLGGGASGASVKLSGSAGTYRAFYSYTGTSQRWQMAFGDNLAESGSNVGSDFFLAASDDSGNPIDNPLRIPRASGSAALTPRPWSFTNATDATSSTAAAVALTGGLAVAKAAWLGTYLGLTSAAAPSLVNGQVWNDSTQACITTYQQALKQTLPGCVLATGDIQTITNTTAETSMSTPGSRFGTSTFPANFFKAGKHIRIDLTGFYNSLPTPGTMTIRVKIGGTARATLVISDLKASGSIVPWSATVVYFCQATGVSGNFDSGGTIIYTGSGGTSLGSLSTGGGTTVDTTASQVIELTAQWATASASNTWTTTSAIYTIFN